jgi:hypothetical protein
MNFDEALRCDRTMKKEIIGLVRVVIAVLLSISIWPLLASGQTIIENPEKPLAKNAGRVLKLQEIWRITDEDGQFYFKYPGEMRISSDGQIFIADESELLKFSPEGKFIKNLFKKGQGPGEIESDFAYFIHNNEIYIYDFMTIKIIQTDLYGELIKQTRIESGPYNGFYGVFKNWLVFLKDVFPLPAERKSKLQDLPCSIRLVSPDAKIEKDNYVFQRQMFFQPNGITSWTRWASILSGDGNRLYVSHTRDYLIEALDLDKGQVVVRFKRKYPSVKYKERGWEQGFYKKFNAPKIKYEIDVSGLSINKDSLWVKTSTNDKEKGDLFDVFDSQGRFIDNFYLGAGRTLLNSYGDTVFVLEKDQAENYRLIKYKIME